MKINIYRLADMYAMTNEKSKQVSRNLNAYLQFLPLKKREAIYCLGCTSVPNIKSSP